VGLPNVGYTRNMANYLEDDDHQPTQLRHIVFIQSYEIYEKHKRIKVEESGFYYSFSPDTWRLDHVSGSYEQRPYSRSHAPQLLLCLEFGLGLMINGYTLW
jgi:hypothetical protein